MLLLPAVTWRSRELRLRADEYASILQVRRIISSLSVQTTAHRVLSPAPPLADANILPQTQKKSAKQRQDVDELCDL